MRNGFLVLTALTFVITCLFPVSFTMAHEIDSEEPKKAQDTSEAQETKDERHVHPSPGQMSEKLTQVPEKWFANVNLILGVQKMQSSDWKDSNADEMGATGFDIDFGNVNWPVNLYLGSGTGTAGSIKSNFVDTYSISTNKIGPRYYFSRKGSTRPYVTAGLALLEAKKNYLSGMYSESVTTDDTTGVFANAGVLFKLGRYVNLGLDITAVVAEGLDGNDDSNYVRAGLVLGFGSP